MNLPAEVTLREVVARDGFQSLQRFIPTKIKIEIIGKILGAGVKEIEATSFVNPLSIPQLKDASKLIASLPARDDDVVCTALVPNLKGIKAAIEARVDKIVFVVSASDSHNKANINRTVKQSLSELKKSFDLAMYKRIPIMASVAVAFGCPYEGSVKIDDVLRISDICLSLGAGSIILADTIGVATPYHVAKMISVFRNKLRAEAFLTMHFHNNCGRAMANLLASMDSGVNSFDTALGGIGGCPYVPIAAGNLPTEDVTSMLDGMKISTGINIKKIVDAALFLEKVIGFNLPGQIIKNRSCMT